MTKLRILLFGGTSQIGCALRALPLPPEWDLKAPDPIACDFTKPSHIGKTIQDFGPDLVINSAALTDIDYCEQNLSEATEVNFHAVANMAAQCSTVDAPLIHLSSDQVFDGQEVTTPYEPDDAMNPLNLFGHTMMMGEEAIRHGLHWHVILRTSSVFSLTHSDLLSQILRALDSGEIFEAAIDRIRSPTSAASIARAVLCVANAILSGKADGFGTFHVSDLEPSSDYAFAQEVISVAGAVKNMDRILRSFKMSEHPYVVPVPFYSALSGAKLESVYQIKQNMWREELSALFAHNRQERA